MTPPQNEITPQWVTYLDLANDVKPYLQRPALAVPEDSKLQLYTDMACQWVQRYLGRPIAPTEFFRRFNGYSGFGGSHIVLPYAPVIPGTVTVVETWGTSGQHTLTEQTPSAQGGADSYSLDPLRGVITRAFAGLIARPFFPGLRNIEVTWTAGYNPIPADIKLATLEIISHWWTNTQEQIRRQRPMEEYDPITSSPSMSAVFERVKPILQTYTQVGMG